MSAPWLYYTGEMASFIMLATEHLHPSLSLSSVKQECPKTNIQSILFAEEELPSPMLVELVISKYKPVVASAVFTCYLYVTLEHTLQSQMMMAQNIY